MMRLILLYLVLTGACTAQGFFVTGSVVPFSTSQLFKRSEVDLGTSIVPGRHNIPFNAQLTYSVGIGYSINKRFCFQLRYTDLSYVSSYHNTNFFLPDPDRKNITNSILIVIGANYTFFEIKKISTHIGIAYAFGKMKHTAKFISGTLSPATTYTLGKPSLNAFVPSFGVNFPLFRNFSMNVDYEFILLGSKNYVLLGQLTPEVSTIWPHKEYYNYSTNRLSFGMQYSFSKK